MRSPEGRSTLRRAEAHVGACTTEASVLGRSHARMTRLQSLFATLEPSRLRALSNFEESFKNSVGWDDRLPFTRGVAESRSRDSTDAWRYPIFGLAPHHALYTQENLLSNSCIRRICLIIGRCRAFHRVLQLSSFHPIRDGTREAFAHPASSPPAQVNHVFQMFPHSPLSQCIHIIVIFT